LAAALLLSQAPVPEPGQVPLIVIEEDQRGFFRSHTFRTELFAPADNDCPIVRHTVHRRTMKDGIKRVFSGEDCDCDGTADRYAGREDLARREELDQLRSRCAAILSDPDAMTDEQ
jgi:hypothetical protein